MKTSTLLLSLALLALGCKAQAQNASPIAEALRSTAERSGKNLVAAAEEMPPGKYGFKPTPAQMSFGDILVHLSEGNDFLCSTVAGGAAPKRAELKVAAGKEKLIARLRESFDFCRTALAKMDDSRLTEQVPWFGDRKVSRAHAVLATAEDWADHYSQMAIYLRLNGLLPPTAKQKE